MDELGALIDCAQYDECVGVALRKEKQSDFSHWAGHFEFCSCFQFCAFASRLSLVWCISFLCRGSKLVFIPAISE